MSKERIDGGNGGGNTQRLIKDIQGDLDPENRLAQDNVDLSGGKEVKPADAANDDVNDKENGDSGDIIVVNGTPIVATPLIEKNDMVLIPGTLTPDAVNALVGGDLEVVPTPAIPAEKPVEEDSIDFSGGTNLMDEEGGSLEVEEKKPLQDDVRDVFDDDLSIPESDYPPLDDDESGEVVVLDIEETQRMEIRRLKKELAKATKPWIQFPTSINFPSLPEKIDVSWLYLFGGAAITTILIMLGIISPTMFTVILILALIGGLALGFFYVYRTTLPLKEQKATEVKQQMVNKLVDEGDDA